jgi:hypothetical protein
VPATSPELAEATGAGDDDSVDAVPLVQAASMRSEAPAATAGRLRDFISTDLHFGDIST